MKALAVVIVAAAICGYLTICLLVYLGSWQFFLHPSKVVARTPSALQVPFDAIRFDATETGTPRLSAWWIPTGSTTAPTLLILHDGKGSMADDVELLASLHQANLNLLDFDYRGFGQSDPTHPNEARMTEDASAALEYLTDTRHIPAATIVPYGIGLGGALAAGLVQGHRELPALILDDPDPDAGGRPEHEERSRLIPVHLLLRDHFDLRTPADLINRPKLVLTGDGKTPGIGKFFESLPAPKLSVTLASPGSADFNADRERDRKREAVTRFIDAYLHR